MVAMRWSGSVDGQELPGVMALERIGQFVQEVDQDGGEVIRQLQRQHHDR